MSAYTRLTYNEDNLADVLSGKISNSTSISYTTPDEIKSKDHFKYLKEYLGIEKGIGAKTIIVEHDYISKDYLVDYASYYASCFDNYSKKCNRVHFFASDFSAEEFEANIVQDKEELVDFWNTYLGFIVAKPIPLKVIGKTVLKTYPKKDSESERIYFGNRKYEVNIFGNKVSVDSLAFMEQDGVVSVCATAAIWMMLQKASCNSYAILKTPSEITDEADIVGTHGERLFPNRGLSVKQISKSIFHSGLVNEIRTKQKTLLSNSYLKRIITAYAPIGIPLILVLEVPEKNKDSQAIYDFHAVTVAGYKIAKYEEVAASELISWRSDSLSKIFVHDDRWGPFARLHFGNGDDEIYNNWSEKFDPKQRTHLTDIIIPVYHKIRISYDDVELVVTALDKILWVMYQKNTSSNVSWDIKLNYSESYKVDSKKFESGLSRKIHLQSMPKYIWVADCYIGGIMIFQFLFDATDVAIGMFGLSITFQSDKIRGQMHEAFAANPNFADFFYHPSKSQFYDFILKESIA